MLSVILIEESFKLFSFDGGSFLIAILPRLMKPFWDTIVFPAQPFPDEEEALQVIDPLPDFHQLFWGEIISRYR
jgi:hypothetical protein